MLSDREGFDKQAEKFIKIAERSQTKPLSLGQALVSVGITVPPFGWWEHTHPALQSLARICDTWGIRVECDLEAWWKSLLK